MSGVAVGIAALALAGCDVDNLVNLQDPDLITGPVARDPANINELRNGVLFEFARAVSGPAANNATAGIVGITGVMTDELWYASTFQAMQEIDARSITRVNGSVNIVYQYIHRARNIADQATTQFEVAGRNNSADQAMVTNVAGYSMIFLAENFCSGVPVSRTALTGDLTFGAPQTTEQMLDTALVRFDAALARATAAAGAQGATAAQVASAQAQQNVARIGRARALLAKGQFAEAAQAVSGISTDFVYNVQYSENAAGQNNGVWYNINSERRTSAASGEGVNGIVFFRRGPAGNNAIDPRVSVDSVGVGIGTTVPHYRQNKYADRGAPIPLATGIEARLIEAEAALNRGQSAAYLPILNNLRTRVTGLQPLTDPGTPEARVRQLFEERAFWLWLTAHRLGDMRRMVRHYQLPQDRVFPTGQTINGTPFGVDVNFPIPQQEQNNPLHPTGECLDRNA